MKFGYKVGLLDRKHFGKAVQMISYKFQTYESALCYATLTIAQNEVHRTFTKLVGDVTNTFSALCHLTGLLHWQTVNCLLLYISFICRPDYNLQLTVLNNTSLTMHTAFVKSIYYSFYFS